jgi:hypothetical protein
MKTVFMHVPYIELAATTEQKAGKRKQARGNVETASVPARQTAYLIPID